MKTSLSQQKFLDSEQAVKIRATLQRMVDDLAFNTDPTYTTEHDDGMPFVDKHMRYLCDHPKLNPDHYLANLRLMTRRK